MNIDQITDCIVSAYPSRQPLHIWGAPGVGKSSAVREAARRLQEQLYPEKEVKRTKLSKADTTFGLIDLRLPLMDPVDLRGLPYVEQSSGLTKWARPNWLPKTGKGILFLDEDVQAPPSMQAAASQLVLDHRIGEHELGEGWMVVAAGNRVSDRAAANAMPTHIANRYVHINAEVSVAGWIAWALKHDLDIRVIAFIKWREALLHKFEPASKVMAFPTPRSWEFVATQLATKTPMAVLPDMVKGSVGDGAAAEFVGFLKVYDKMPSIDQILMNPASAPLPVEPAVLYAVTSTMAHRANENNIGHIATYFGRLTDAGRPEFSVIAMKEIVGKKPLLGNNKSFIAWAAKHQGVL